MNHDPINKDSPLVLASISPRRKAILKQIGIPFEAVGGMVDETPSKVMRPADIACQMAIRKAESVRYVHKNRWILGADTIVVIDRRVFGKPKDSRDCHEMLLRLSGRNHRVITGFCILEPGGKSAHLESVTTKVKVKEIKCGSWYHICSVATVLLN